MECHRHNRKVDVEELTSFQDWLRQMVDGEAITQVDDYEAQNLKKD